MKEIRYDNYVSPDNVFGHALELLSRHVDEVRGGVHLDIACGHARIAEHVRDRFGVDYVGIDIDEVGVGSLRERGFEGHVADLSGPKVTQILRDVLGDRRLVSISCLDGLEHLAEGKVLLEAIGSLLAEHRAIAVFSVPNVTHLDVSIKNLLGHWTYTETGLLDSTHVQLYSAHSLDMALCSAGLQKVDSYDIVMFNSDQHFPAGHVGLSRNSSFNQWLRKVRGSAEPHAMTNQFVWAVAAVPRRMPDPTPAADDPFATIIMRTQGRRAQEFREALLCLASQSFMDFEVIVVLHRGNVQDQMAVERVIEDQPPRLRDRLRLVLLDHGQRSAPLNLALSQARGRYIGMFDDDDLVLGTWMESFARADRSDSGRILRAVSLCQDVRQFEVRGVVGVRADDSPKRIHSLEFQLSEHLFDNQSPNLSWVFPRSLYTDFGLRFDESMTTTEDWDFLLRASEIAGVKDIAQATSIYQWWTDRESSKTVHRHEEWAANRGAVERHIDSAPILLPAGETRALRRDLLRLRELDVRATEQEGRLHEALLRIAFLERKISRLKRKRQAALRKLRGERRQNRRRAAAHERGAVASSPADRTGWRARVSTGATPRNPSRSRRRG